MMPRSKTMWSNKSMRLKPETRYIFEYIKNAEHYTDNELVEYMMLALLFIHKNSVKFGGFAATNTEKLENYEMLKEYYKVTNNGN